MSDLSDLRSSLADAIRARFPDDQWTVYDTVPETLTAPAIVVRPDEPYLAVEPGAGLNFGEVIVRHYVAVIAGRGTNQKRADELDAALSRLLLTDTAPHVWERTDQPGALLVNKQEHLGVAVRYVTVHRLHEETP